MSRQWATLLALAAFLNMACGNGRDGDGNTPPSVDNSFLYVASQAVNTVSAFKIDTTTGALTPVPGSPFTAGDGAKWVAIAPSGKFAYVANYEAGTISAFAIDASSGALEAVAGSPFQAAPYIAFLTVHPSGEFLCAANYYSGSISVFSVDRVTGAIRRVSDYGLGMGSQPLCAAIDPSGRYLYAPDFFVDVYGFHIDTTGGWLRPVSGSPIRTGGIYPSYAVVDQSGLFLYVSNYYSRNIDGFAIDTSSGALTPLSGSPFPLREVAAGPMAIVFDPAFRFAYVVNIESSSFSIFAFDSFSGTMTEIPGSPFRFRMEPFPGPALMAIHPAGRFAYVSNFFSADVAAYALDAGTGLMTELARSPYPVGDEPVGLAIAHIRR